MCCMTWQQTICVGLASGSRACALTEAAKEHLNRLSAFSTASMGQDATQRRGTQHMCPSPAANPKLATAELQAVALACCCAKLGPPQSTCHICHKG